MEFLPVSAPYAARHILLNVRPGGLIILHDGVPDLERTIAVLERILPALRRRGYRVVTVSELAAAGQATGHDGYLRSGPWLHERWLVLEAGRLAPTRGWA